MKNNSNNGVVLKLITAGQSSVGKTSLLERFYSNTFTQIRPCTTVCDFQYRVVQKFNISLRMQLWDTSGQERFLSLSPIWFRQAAGLTLVYDIADRKSFENIQFWINEALKVNPRPNPAVILIGNKCDLEDEREVSYQEGQSFAQSYGFQFIETSARTALNVESGYDQLINQIVELL